jgi:hypothetical protein
MELVTMVELNKIKNKKRKVYVGLILLLLLLGGFCTAFQANQIEDQSASSELLLGGDVIEINPGEDQVAAVESMAVPFLGGASAPESSNQTADNSLGIAPLAIGEADQFSFLPILVPQSNEQGEQGEAEKPGEPAVIETEEEIDEESNENVSEENGEAEEENAEEPQPEEPVYERTVYNFGDSEQFKLTQNVIQEDFNAKFIVKQNSWKVDEDGSGLSAAHNGEGRIFVSNNYLNYFVKVVAALNAPDSTVGGYAVMFETKLDSNNNDAGFALQFDRGYGSGEIVIRAREIGADSKGNPRTNEVTTPLYRYSDREVLPNKNNDPNWWAEEHQMELQVTELEGKNEKGHNKNLSVYLDDNHLFDWTFESKLEEDNDDNHVGLRVWGASAKEVEFIGLEIGELPATTATEPALPEPSAAGSAKPEASSEPEADSENE